MALTREDLQAIGELLDVKLEEKFKETLSPIEGRLDSIEGRLDSIEGRLDSVEGRLDSIEGRLDSVEGRLDSVEGKLDSLALHVENVTDKNIQTVAEGHLDLSRKLDEALKVENEKELLIIRVRILEDEMRRAKERLAELEQSA